MKKSLQSEEKINQKYRKRYQPHHTLMVDKHLPNSLRFELIQDYRELKNAHRSPGNAMFSEWIRLRAITKRRRAGHQTDS